ncbi:unnamed protein product [Nippostrongylus brasiliensis]|uniref:PlsC domain-containing protein n=1 Tax=Nippostrongylus brasiliensis TaxID=27835 RepID=A0A0N4XTA4_NIPBR|nr:unnamed protein product [Nippostrongylus brasiliensis]
MLVEAVLDGHPPAPIPHTEDVNASAEVNGSVDANHNVMDFRKLIALAGAAYFIVMTAFIVPVACVATVVLLFPLVYLNLPLFIYLENRLCTMVNNHWVSASVHCGLNTVEYGSDIGKYAKKRCLFLVNHLGLTDHFVVMQALHDKGNVPGSWLWVIYNIWKYTPLGIMWSSHGNFFINGGASRKAALLSSFRKHLCNLFHKFNFHWIVMYPEGSRLFLIKESSSRFAEKLKLPQLRHCAYPRSGAAHAVLDVLGPTSSHGCDSGDSVPSRCGEGPAIDYIIDATIVAPEWAVESKLQEFLYKRYQEKDALLHDYYRTGHFPGEGRPVIVSHFMMLFSQLFWIGLYYCHHTIWIRPLFSIIASAFL